MRPSYRTRRARPVHLRGGLPPPAQAIALGSIATAESVPGPGVTQTQVVTLGSIGTATGAMPGPTISQTGVAPSPTFTPRTTAAVYSRGGALLTPLPDSFAKTWQHVWSDTGEGSLRLQNDDAALALFSYGDVVVFSTDASARFAALVERLTRVRISTNEEVDQVTTAAGRSRLAIMEEAVVDRNINGLQDTRLFNFASPDLDDSAWGHAVQNEQGRGDAGGSREGAPEGWPDDSAWWIWDRPAPTTGSSPVGDVYFRRWFTVAAAGRYALFTAADDIEDVWVNGIRLVNRAEFWGTTKRAEMDFAAGTHLVAVRGTNTPPTGGPNPGGMILTIKELGGDGELGATVVNTDGTWLALGYPANPPGFTPGAVLRILIEEAQARGALAGLTWSFGDWSDSDGVPWPVTGDISVQIGQDYLSIVRQLCETYMEVAMDVGSFRLHAYGGRSVSSGATFAAAVNLTELTHEGTV